MVTLVLRRVSTGKDGIKNLGEVLTDCKPIDESPRFGSYGSQPQHGQR
jgi:hypothetical protein